MGTWTYVQVRANAKGVFDTSLAQAAQILRVILANQIYKQRLAELQATLNTPYSKHTVSPANHFTKVEADELKRLNSNQLVFQVWNNQGTLLLKSANAPSEPLATVSFGSQDTQINQSAWRTFTLPDYRQGLRFITAIRADIATRFSAGQVLKSLYPLLFFCPLLALLIWVLLDWGFRPLNRIRTLLAKRGHDNLEDPIELRQAPEEIRPIVEELNSLFSRLQGAFEREKRFTADAAHELRTPLAAIRTHSQIASRSAENKNALDALSKVTKSVDRATRVIEQLLVLSRLEPQDKLLPEGPVNISSFSQELLVDLVPMALAKNIELSLNAPKKPLFIETQSAMLNILIRNLIDNAIRYTPDQGEVEINLSPDPQKGGVQIEVIDSGPGVPPELRRRIFDRFYRQVGNKAEGSGLGLSIVQLIVHLHNGTISADSRLDGKSGLRIRIWLPENPLG
ncbi:ATP-binding protein [Piscirickettsia litoralis]|uniref:histidine kinase n=1 Tax=Piscirickettsia litoralis TaxID=1891921 RepID=A0ABX3A694_9GAMM|nr:ATP-binding protein [Piscirickettsia litoralis]ODN43968.1 histidine kinase [Piscirickettsia litoralis]